MAGRDELKSHCAKILMLLLGIVALAPVAYAQESWTATRLNKKQVTPALFAETRPAAPSGIPYMLKAEAASGDIVAAWYSQPTTRYDHGVLGDKIEGGALVVQKANGRTYNYRLSPLEVFEDIAPRIADLDGDGVSEVVTILSSLPGGASIAIFGMNGDTVEKLVSTPFIGRPNRWLNIAAIAKFGRGAGKQIAFVATPHIGGNLGFLAYGNRQLALVKTASGFSNHKIGSPELRLGAAADIDGDGVSELALPGNDRKSLKIVRLTSDGIKTLASVSLPSPIDKAIIAEGTGKATTFTVGLENGSAYKIAR
ncbi:MAG: hypothetical protein KDJ67_09460 [Nitratireductor sp.]|nr:hypothetical protein [Nitratireductor sp.]